MKVIKLSADAVIDDQFHRRGEVVPVEDGYDASGDVVIAPPEQMAAREKAAKERTKKPKKETDAPTK